MTTDLLLAILYSPETKKRFTTLIKYLSGAKKLTTPPPPPPLERQQTDRFPTVKKN